MNETENTRTDRKERHREIAGLILLIIFLAAFLTATFMFNSKRTYSLEEITRVPENMVGKVVVYKANGDVDYEAYDDDARAVLKKYDKEYVWPRGNKVHITQTVTAFDHHGRRMFSIEENGNNIIVKRGSEFMPEEYALKEGRL